MAQTLPITEAAVRALASAQSYDRGYRYYRSSSVFDITRRGNFIAAKVEGSDYDPYRIEVTVDDTGVIDTSCTCPYDWGGICKHIVATLLIAIHQPEAIVEKPSLTILLADLTADQLRRILLGMAEMGSEFADLIEREVTWLRDQPDASATSSSLPVLVDLSAIRREIHKDFRLAGKGDSFQLGYYDEYAGLEVYPDEILQPHLEKVGAQLDAGDVETAVTLINTIMDAYTDGLTDLDEWVYEYNDDVLNEANLTLGATLAEVLLSLDMKPKQQERWLAQIDDWEDALGDLAIAETAIKHGWSYPPLVAAMQGHITEKGAWEGDAPDFADELAQVRLHILARQGRTQAYIHLAEAEGQTELAINMMAQSGDIEKAVAEAKAYLVYPREMLILAQTLAAKGELAAALNVAEHGLSLEPQHGKVELAQWTRQQASTAGNHELALNAAQLAFSNSYALVDYTALQQLAGDKWQTIKPKLLQKLQQSQSVSHKIDIFLHENMLTEAMQALDKTHFAMEHELHRVIEATKERHPDWGIRKCQRQAEVIMDEGKAKVYDTAVSWLRTARDIYLQHQRQQQWEAYLNSLLEKHQRKYKLVPMLSSIRA